MSEKYYTKETGWTEAGIREQERRADLPKLTAEELLIRMGPVRWHEHSDAWDEIRRRLERLEQCEAFCKYAQHHPSCIWLLNDTPTPCDCGYDAARAAVDGK